jgi:hypothetical protein
LESFDETDEQCTAAKSMMPMIPNLKVEASLFMKAVFEKVNADKGTK